MNAYLNFPPGKTRPAFELYQKVLDAKLLFLHTWGESPMAGDAPNGDKDAVMHATLQFPDGAILMAADCPPEYQKPFGGFSLSAHAKDIDEAERMFAGLSENGEVTMPLAETFWAKRFGMCVDPFGVPWMINCEMTPPE
ncbi:VOC family protein [Lysobacter sp. HDW10]|uniref:VOC family protein n=1 Tax=Lysobacter sp. HDW10 TaxID=2714936 RepID=UPI00140D3C54|nr:VOC family protein [Lysobacter sp. HDW10]QIK80678.1 VOC family protein [Lysobacter sp. HDW10]